jgi:DNA-binding CsgD family transcriptional regulator
VTGVLTPRQAQVLDLVALGLPNKEIAARLGLTIRSVKNLLHSAYAALGATNRVEALIASGRHVVVEVPGALPCGHESRCTRPAGHRGHHGGWRPLPGDRTPPPRTGGDL